MSSEQNNYFSGQSDAEETRKEKNRIAVKKHRATRKEEEEKRKAAIQHYKEENSQLEKNIQVLRAEGEIFRSIVEAHDRASGGQFSRTPEGYKLVDIISQIDNKREQKKGDTK